MEIPNFRVGCIKITFLAVMAVSLVGCVATINHKYPDGSTSEIKVPFSYRWNEQTKTLESDERIVQASSDALIKMAEKSPEIIEKLSKHAMEAQKQDK